MKNNIEGKWDILMMKRVDLPIHKGPEVTQQKVNNTFDALSSDEYEAAGKTLI